MKTNFKTIRLATLLVFTFVISSNAKLEIVEKLKQLL